MTIDLTRNTPSHFWPYVLFVTLCVGALAWAGLEMTEPGLLRFMGAGALLALAALLYSPSCLDMTGWTMTVYLMLPAGVILFVGSPLAYALWVAFVGPHVEVTIK